MKNYKSIINILWFFYIPRFRCTLSVFIVGKGKLLLLWYRSGKRLFDETSIRRNCENHTNVVRRTYCSTACRETLLYQTYCTPVRFTHEALFLWFQHRLIRHSIQSAQHQWKWTGGVIIYNNRSAQYFTFHSIGAVKITRGFYRWKITDYQRSQPEKGMNTAGAVYAVRLSRMNSVSFIENRVSRNICTSFNTNLVLHTTSCSFAYSSVVGFSSVLEYPFPSRTANAYPARCNRSASFWWRGKTSKDLWIARSVNESFFLSTINVVGRNECCTILTVRGNRG